MRGETAAAAAERNPPPRSTPLLGWVLVSAIHYHDARLRAAARLSGLHLDMIELTDTFGFRELQPGSPSESFTRHTLFSGVPWQTVDRRVMVKRLHERLAALRPRVVCINGWSSGGCIASLIWCLRAGVPVILMSESAEHDERRRWWKEMIKRRTVGLCSAALVGGITHRDYLVKLGFPGERVFDGYDVVDNAHFESGAAAARLAAPQRRAELGLPPRYFLACSRFEAKKNLGRLLDAYAAYLKAAGTLGWALVVVGDGPLRGDLEAQCKRLGLNGHVMFPGFKGYEELPAYYGLAEAFVHASTTEQWGLVVNEAMAAGLPVVVSRRCGCAAELVIEGVNGFTVDPFDVAALADAMARVAADSCHRAAMGRFSREIVGRWSPDRFARNLAAAADAALRSGCPTPNMIDRLVLWVLKNR